MSPPDKALELSRSIINAAVTRHALVQNDLEKLEFGPRTDDFLKLSASARGRVAEFQAAFKGREEERTSTATTHFLEYLKRINRTKSRMRANQQVMEAPTKAQVTALRKVGIA